MIVLVLVGVEDLLNSNEGGYFSFEIRHDIQDCIFSDILKKRHRQRTLLRLIECLKLYL